MLMEMIRKILVDKMDEELHPHCDADNLICFFTASSLNNPEIVFSCEEIVAKNEHVKLKTYVMSCLKYLTYRWIIVIVSWQSDPIACAVDGIYKFLTICLTCV